MTEQELLEMSAKAIGLDGFFEDKKEMIRSFVFERRFGIRTKTGRVWNPLEDDGDALRMAVKLKMIINISDTLVSASDGNSDSFYPIANIDQFAAARYAITHVAAEIGRAMNA